MNFTQRHADDITHYLLRSIGVLIVLSAAGILALVIVEPTSYWEGRAGGMERAPMPCVKDRSMQLWTFASKESNSMNSGASAIAEQHSAFCNTIRSWEDEAKQPSSKWAIQNRGSQQGFLWRERRATRYLSSMSQQSGPASSSNGFRH